MPDRRVSPSGETTFLQAGDSFSCSFQHDDVQQRLRTLGVQPSFANEIHKSPIRLKCLREKVCLAKVNVEQRFKFRSRCYANCPNCCLVPIFEPLSEAIHGNLLRLIHAPSHSLFKGFSIEQRQKMLDTPCQNRPSSRYCRSRQDGEAMSQAQRSSTRW